MLCNKVYGHLFSALCASVRLLHYTRSNYRLLVDEVKEYKSRQRFDDEGEEIGSRSRSYRRDGRNGYGNNTVANSNSDSLAANTIQANYMPPAEKKGFYDAETNFCELCQESLEASYRGHSMCNEHMARTGIYERAILLIDRYLEHLMQVNTRRDYASYRRSTSNNNSNSSNNNNTSHYHHYHNNANNDLTCLFAFFDQALPYDKEVIRAEPSLLENVNLLNILIDYWWQSINCTSAVEDLTNAMRFAVGSCASYLTHIQETDRTYNFRERSLIEIKSGEQINKVDFDRITALSSSNMMERKWRISFLLNFLRERGILRNSLQISFINEEMIIRQRSEQKNCNTFMLSERFERAEMVGDEVMKAMSFDRLARMFPLHECGGIDEQLYLILRLIDCNHGLLTIYDYLDMDRLLQMRLPNSKSKSDVVEAIFGELECWLTSSEVACGVERFPIDPSPEFKYVRALVKHTLNEMSHVVFMWEIEQTLRNVSSFVKSHIAHSPLLRMTKRAVNNQLRDEERDRAPHDLLPLLTKVKRVQPLTKDTGKSAWVCAQELSSTYQSKVTPFEETLSKGSTIDNVKLNSPVEPNMHTTETSATVKATAKRWEIRQKWPLSIPYLLPVVVNKTNYKRSACKLLEQTDLKACSEVYKVNTNPHTCKSAITMPLRADSSINTNTDNESYNFIEYANLSTAAQRYKAWRQSEIDLRKREIATNALQKLQLPEFEVSKLLSDRVIALSSSMQTSKVSALPDFSLKPKQM